MAHGRKQVLGASLLCPIKSLQNKYAATKRGFPNTSRISRGDHGNNRRNTTRYAWEMIVGSGVRFRFPVASRNELANVTKS